jgi:hypothetical protein
MRNRDIVAASVVLGFSFVSIMVVVARFLWVHHRPRKDHKDEGNEYSVERQSSFFSKGGAFTKLFAPVCTLIKLSSVAITLFLSNMEESS